MADTSLRARLSRLFATNVVVRRIAKNRLKAVDTNRLQSTGNITNKRYVDRFSGVHRGMPGYGTYNQNQNFHTSKIELFTDYEGMDMDPIIASALDIYADEMTTHSILTPLLKIDCHNEELKSILEELYYSVLNIESNLFSWCRNMCKYGDYFLYLDIDEAMGGIMVV